MSALKHQKSTWCVICSLFSRNGRSHLPSKHNFGTQVPSQAGALQAELSPCRTALWLLAVCLPHGPSWLLILATCSAKNNTTILYWHCCAWPLLAQRHKTLMPLTQAAYSNSTVTARRDAFGFDQTSAEDTRQSHQVPAAMFFNVMVIRTAKQ